VFSEGVWRRGGGVGGAVCRYVRALGAELLGRRWLFLIRRRGIIRDGRTLLLLQIVLRFPEGPAHQ